MQADEMIKAFWQVQFIQCVKLAVKLSPKVQWSRDAPAAAPASSS